MPLPLEGLAGPGTLVVVVAFGVTNENAASVAAVQAYHPDASLPAIFELDRVGGVSRFFPASLLAAIGVPDIGVVRVDDQQSG